MQDGMDSRLDKACQELIVKDRIRTAARDKAVAEAEEEARTHTEVTGETFDCNMGKAGIVAQTELMYIPKGQAAEWNLEGVPVVVDEVSKKGDKEPDPEAEQTVHDSDDDDFDDGDAIERFRAKRIAELKAKKSRRNKNRAFGEFREIVESEFLETVTKHKFAVVHFFHREFERCKIMDKHLRQVAHCHDELKFVKLNAEKAPFFVTKLCIKTLPSVIFFTKGVAMSRITGFEGLDGGRDNFRTRQLERQILLAGLIQDETPMGTYPDDDMSDSEEESF